MTQTQSRLVMTVLSASGVTQPSLSKKEEEGNVLRAVLPSGPSGRPLALKLKGVRRVGKIGNQKGAYGQNLAPAIRKIQHSE